MGKKQKEIAWVEDENGCWICNSHCRNAHGYPLKSFRGKSWLMHRVIYTQKRGKIPEGMFVCHTCDNPGCIRIDHLWLGTNADNMMDMKLKGRHKKNDTRGEKSGTHKLTEIQAIQILNSSESCTELAKRFSVVHQQISRIKTGKRWKHLQRSQM